MNICSHHEQSILAVGDHVLHESKKEQVKETLEPTQQELVVRTSQEAGFSKKNRCCSNFQNETHMRCSWKKHCAWWQIIYQTKIYRRSMIKEKHPQRNQNQSHSGRFRLRGSRSHVHRHQSVVTVECGKYCMDTCKQWSHTIHANLQNSHQRSKDPMFFLNGGTAAAQAQPEDPDLCLGDRLRFILKSRRHHHPTACTQASQIPPGRESGDRLLSSHPQCPGETHRSHVKFT